MTLHCNKVKLWPCPEWVATVCLHEIHQFFEVISETRGVFIDSRKRNDWALERYLMWAEAETKNSMVISFQVNGYTESHILSEEFWNNHKKEVLAAMSSQDLKVWIQ